MSGWPVATDAERIRPTPRRMLAESVPDYLRRMRAAINRSIPDVIEDSGLCRASVYNAEAGKPVTWTVAVKLADALGFDPREIAVEPLSEAIKRVEIERDLDAPAFRHREEDARRYQEWLAAGDA